MFFVARPACRSFSQLKYKEVVHRRNWNQAPVFGNFKDLPLGLAVTLTSMSQ